MPLSPRSRAELSVRQQATPPPQAPPMPACTRCGGEPLYLWQQMCDGRKHLRVECNACGRFLKFAPQVEPFVGFANRTTSETAVLDVLRQCDALGIELQS